MKTKTRAYAALILNQCLLACIKEYVDKSTKSIEQATLGDVGALERGVEESYKRAWKQSATLFSTLSPEEQQEAYAHAVMEVFTRMYASPLTTACMANRQDLIIKKVEAFLREQEQAYASMP